MDSLRFSHHLETRSAKENAGDLFQEFVHELLLYEYPGLHLFPGGGKDGSIDIIQDTDESRLVIECKHISKDGLTEARKRWKGVADNLQKHLVDPAGPTKTQSQYKPWYRTDPPISEYLFCISSVLTHHNQFDELRQDINQFFIEIGTLHKHLSHLTNIKVRILDWNDLHNRLRQHPHILFRWFPISRPQGLIPIDEIPTRGTFRSYLFSDKLPYYSRRQFLEISRVPPSISIPSEEEILNQIENENITGLVVTGSGGVGKTRFTLEIGRLAKQKGWMVMRVLNRLQAKALEQLIERLPPETRVLLLFDYIETQRNFVEIVQTLVDLNETYSLHLRYIANCRTSYYSSIAAASVHKRIDLSPITHESFLQEWTDAYQKQTVLHILEHSDGLEITESHLKICRNIPVFAVFISYLHGTGRHPALKQLVDEEDFSSWVLKRIELTFGSPVIPQYLAMLSALFPFPVSAVSQLGDKMYSELLDKLATDGWVEKLSPDLFNPVERWEVVQDVFADQIFISYLKSIPRTVDLFIKKLLSWASKVGGLRSTLLSLERVKDHPLVGAIDWLSILETQMSEEPLAWRGVRDLLIRITLLHNQQIIDLLGKNDEVWIGIEEEVSFQYSLGYIARWAKDQPDHIINSTHRDILTSWIQKTAGHATLFNYIITSGVLFSPEIVRGPALNWILARPEEFQTHYLLRAWMIQSLPIEEIHPSVKRWLDRFSHIFHYSFVVKAWLKAGGDKELVRATLPKWLALYKTNPDAQFTYKAWLNAGGDKELVRDEIVEWLTQHKSLPQAQFVYEAWLKAGGDRELVRDEIVEWLTLYKTNPETRFVYEAWLDAGGDKELVRDEIVEWLTQHKSLPQAQFVYEAWLKAGGDREMIRPYLMDWLKEYSTKIEADFVYKSWIEAGEEFSEIAPMAFQWLSKNSERSQTGFLLKYIVKLEYIPHEAARDILKWCRRFPADEDVLWRLTQLKTHLLSIDLAEDLCVTAEAVIEYLMTHPENISSEGSSQIATLFSYLISSSALRDGELRERVDRLLLLWLRNLASFGDDPKPHISIQRINYFQRVVDLIKSDKLDISKDREVLERFLWWVNNWELKWKSRLRRTIDYLKHNYPPSELWDIVKTSPSYIPQPHPPRALIEACVKGDCVLFVGAGLSTRAGLPNWQQLIRALFEWSIRNQFIKESSSELPEEPLGVEDTESVVEKISFMLQEHRDALLSYLKSRLLQTSQLSNSHKILSELNFSAILTSNFDNLLEQAFGNRDAVVCTPRDADSLIRFLHNGEFFILKLYGRLEYPEDLIISPTQFEAMIKGCSTFSEFIAELFQSKTIFFIGASLSGIENDLQKMGLAISQRSHYALVAINDEDWREKAASMESKYGIKLLPYITSPNHYQVPQFLQQLAQSSKNFIHSHYDKNIDPTIYLTKIRLENIGPFDELEIELNPTWNILFGDNGVGKSVILKAIGFAICGKDAQRYARKMIKVGRDKASITLETNRGIYRTDLLVSRGVIELNTTSGSQLEARHLLAIGLPPSRTVSWRPSNQAEAAFSGELLPILKGGRERPTESIKQWILDLGVQSKNGKSIIDMGGYENEISAKFFDIIFQLTQGLIIKCGEINPETDEVKVITKDGELPIEALSRGVKSLMAWVGILLRHLYDAYEGLEEPDKQYTLVLIDEIDAHMHPTWQELLVPKLKEIFPNIQFIATTHSLFIAGDMPPKQLIRLTRNDAGRIVQLKLKEDMLTE